MVPRGWWSVAALALLHLAIHVGAIDWSLVPAKQDDVGKPPAGCSCAHADST